MGLIAKISQYLFGNKDGSEPTRNDATQPLSPAVAKVDTPAAVKQRLARSSKQTVAIPVPVIPGPSDTQRMRAASLATCTASFAVAADKLQQYYDQIG